MFRFGAIRWRVAFCALCLEIVVCTFVVAPHLSREWFVPLIPFIAPGFIVLFLLGGGMSIVDGLVPDSKLALPMILGFLLNTVIMYVFCLVVSKCYKIARPQFCSKDLK